MHGSEDAASGGFAYLCGVEIYPVQSAPTHGRNVAAGEFASASAILALAGLCFVLLVFSALPGRGEAGSNTDPARHQSATAHSLLEPQIESRLYIIVTGESDAVDLNALLEAEALLRSRLGERQRTAEVIGVSSDREAEAVAESINTQASLPDVPGMRAVVVK